MKRKILTILLISLMLMGSIPVFAANEDSTVGIPTTIAEVKKAVPQARIVEYADDFEAYSIVNGEVVYNIDSLNPESVPVETYFREYEDGNFTLYVYEDGSYNLITTEIEKPKTTRGTSVSISDGSPNIATFTYTGTSTQKITFKAKFYDNQSGFVAKAYSYSFTPWSTYSYGGTTVYINSAKTSTYVQATLMGVAYNEMGAPMTYNIAKHRLTANRAGTGNPTCSFSSYNP